MASYNRVILVGNLTRDPEFKQLPSGQAVCRLGLATNRTFKNRQTGAATQEVCFIDVDVWGSQGENCHKYLQKGRSVLVEGRLKLDSWEQDGQKRSRHSVVADRVTFLQVGQEEGAGYDGRSSAEDDLSSSRSSSAQSATGEVDLSAQQKPFEDDLPF
jgi:single-strand DNA-binding protein